MWKGEYDGKRNACPTIWRRNGDGVPVSEPWMPPDGGTPWLQGEGRRAI
jgi:hypothetical protein